MIESLKKDSTSLTWELRVWDSVNARFLISIVYLVATTTQAQNKIIFVFFFKQMPEKDS